MVTGRQGNKTQAMIEWLLGGEPVKGHPGWSRAIVCANANMAWNLMRRVYVHSEQVGVDLRQCVVVAGSSDLVGSAVREIGVDDAELVLQALLKGRGLITFMTISGETVA